MGMTGGKAFHKVTIYLNIYIVTCLTGDRDRGGGFSIFYRFSINLP